MSYLVFCLPILHIFLMERKFKQCWSSNPSISTQGTITFLFISLNTNKDHDIWHWKSRSWLGTGTKIQLKSLSSFSFWFILLKPLSTIFQLYCASQFYWWRKPKYLEKNIDLSQVSCIEYTSPLTRFELITLVVIGTDCTGSC